MSLENAQQEQGVIHCQPVSLGVEDAAESTSTVASTSGDAFDVAIHLLSAGEFLSSAPQQHGEEVGAVISGTFTIVAAGECYQLSRGEGIIIPSGEARTWTCDSPNGRLYRVINRTSLMDNAGETP